MSGLFVASIFLSIACGPSEPSTTESAAEPKTVANVERGQYLAENVMLCFACHSELDWKAPGAPPIEGKKGAGSPFPETNLPFSLNCANITPDPETGAGKWTDEQLGRAIREGVGHDGRVLFPAMPYPLFHTISDEDLAALIAYLRTIPPIRHEMAKTPLPPPLQEALRPMPVSPPVPPPNFADSVERGKYMAALGNCFDCHTPLDEQGQPMMELAFSGGRVLVGAWGTVASGNITQDASGINYYDQDLFLQVMKTGNVKARKLNPVMLWGYFRNMTDEDLKAIFAYLRTLPPIKHRADNTEAPSYCKLCRQKHGLGDRN